MIKKQELENKLKNKKENPLNCVEKINDNFFDCFTYYSWWID